MIREIFEDIPHNLVIKTPSYAYQKEYRIIGRDRSNVAFYQTRITLAAKLKNTTMQSLTWQEPRGLFPEGPGTESPRNARRPHAEAPASRIANPARTTTPLANQTPSQPFN